LKQHQSRLGRAFLLIASFSLVELATAIYSNSLTLLADAGHMLLDTVALGLAWLALKLSQLPATSRFTFGYHRTQVLAAFVNSLLLGLLVLWILIEALMRITSPQAMLPLPALAVALLGLIVNLIAFFWLNRGKENINVRAAALHVLGDILGSLAAIISALIVYFTGYLTIDALLALLVVVILSLSIWRVMKMSISVLLEAAPSGLDADTVRQVIASIDGVVEVQELRIWALTPEQPLATVRVAYRQGRDHQLIAQRIEDALAERFGVTSVTVQVIKTL